MFARSTTVLGRPQSFDAGITYLRDRVMPAVLGLEGYVGLSMLADHDTGRCIITSAWTNAETMHASALALRAMRERAASILGGHADVEEWEIAVLHRACRTADGACTRVAWSWTTPERVDEVLDTCRTEVLPQLEALPGFCSVSVLVGREVGRLVTAVSYENRKSLEASRERAAAMRAAVLGSTDVRITEVAEFDLVLAHLRVPETV
ncbi:MAG TPA: hypothetical protein VHF92_10625 [Geodermatophilus sp.]|nr:hypothetical protein [Geodermatophilus sp.]